MGSDRRWLVGMSCFVLVCLSVPFWAPRGGEPAKVDRPVADAAPAKIGTAQVAEPQGATSQRHGQIRSASHATPEASKPTVPLVAATPPRPPGEPREAYYMLLFATDSPSNLARESHTFATFMRLKTDGDVEAFDTHTISWMPASMVIVPLGRGAEPGKNLSLDETFDWAETLNSRFTAWGPYEIKKELYERSKQQFQRLQKGEVMYKMLDVRFRPNVAINCIHAVCDIAPADMLLTGSAYGEEAAGMVGNYLRPWIINVGEAHEALISRLGLPDANITFRKLEPIAQVASP